MSRKAKDTTAVPVWRNERKGMFKKEKRPCLTIAEKWSDSFLCTYPVSYKYNGGTSIDGKWYEGYKVPAPRIPEGFELVYTGISLDLNARPPLATDYLRPLNGGKVKKKELQAAIARTHPKPSTPTTTEPDDAKARS